MANDQGFKISFPGETADTDDLNKLMMSTKFTHAKVDLQKTNTFRTTTVNFLTSPPKNTGAVKIASFAHGYNYIPQVWGLWKVLGGSKSTMSGQTGYAYGFFISSTSPLAFTLYYVVTASVVDLYCSVSDPFVDPTFDMVGTQATLTTYVFADELAVTP